MPAAAAVGTSGTTPVAVPNGANRFAPGSGATPTAGRPAPAPEPLAAPPRHTRWRKTSTTFGPVGRVLCTTGLVVPFVFLLVMGLLAFDPFVLGGAGLWGVIVMPWGLRDTWRAGQLPAR